MPTETRTKPLDRLLRAASHDPDRLVRSQQQQCPSNSLEDLVVGHPVVEDLLAASKVAGAEAGDELV